MTEANGGYIIVNFAVDQEFASVPRSFTAAYDGIIHAKPERSALLIIGTDWGSGTFNNEADELIQLAAAWYHIARNNTRGAARLL